MKTKRWNVLQAMIKRHGYRTVVELGVLRGDTMLYLLENCPAVTVYGVDVWRPLHKPVNGKSLETGVKDYTDTPLCSYYERLLAATARYGGRAILLRETTLEAADRFTDGTVDLVFVDADHQTESVIADVRAWLPKVRPGGTIAGHDRQWPSVRRALDALPELSGWMGEPDNVWWRAV